MRVEDVQHLHASLEEALESQLSDQSEVRHPSDRGHPGKDPGETEGAPDDEAESRKDDGLFNGNRIRHINLWQMKNPARQQTPLLEESGCRAGFVRYSVVV